MSLQTVLNYDTPANFVFDGAKVGITTLAALLLQVNPKNFNQPFDSSTGFTFDSAKTEFTGGLVRQKDQRPAGSPTFGANYDTNINGNWSGGSLTGTGTGSPTVAGGKLDLKGGTKYVDYSAVGNANSAQVGCVRMRYTPNYTGIPSAWRVLWAIANSAGSLNNRIELRHSSSAGQLQVRINASGGGSIATHTLANWLPTAGVEYEIEFNWDLTTGAHRLFINGVQHGATMSSTGTRSTVATLFRVGADYNATDKANAEFNDVVVFPTVQHTTNYTPGYTVPDNPYAADTITLPQFTHSGPVGSVIKTLASFSTTEAGTPRYSLRLDGGTYRYWDGAAWSASDGTYAQAASKADTNTNIGTFPGADGATTATVRIHTSTGATQASVADLTLGTTAETTYPTDNPTVLINTGTIMDGLDGFVEVASKSGADEIKYILVIDGVDTYFNGSAWVTSDGTYAQSNTAAEIQTNKATLDISGGISEKTKAFLHSDDGTTTPTLTSVTIDYNFAAGSPTSADTCIIYGWLKDALDNPRVGVTVKATPELDFKSNDILVTAFGTTVSTTTDSNGYWELNLVRDTGTYEFRLGNRRYRGVMIPAKSTEKFVDLV